MGVRSSLATLLLGVGLALVLAGCDRMTSSGIPKASNSDTPMLAAGSPQSLTIALGNNGAAWEPRSAENERRLSATISSGTNGCLLAAYCREMERTITGLGGEIGERAF